MNTDKQEEIAEAFDTILNELEDVWGYCSGEDVNELAVMIDEISAVQKRLNKFLS